jgi:hypothetical protein
LSEQEFTNDTLGLPMLQVRSQGEMLCNFSIKYWGNAWILQVLKLRYGGINDDFFVDSVGYRGGLALVHLD